MCPLVVVCTSIGSRKRNEGISIPLSVLGDLDYFGEGFFGGYKVIQKTKVLAVPQVRRAVVNWSVEGVGGSHKEGSWVLELILGCEVVSYAY